MIVLGGKSYGVPGIVTVSWLDNPRRVPKIVKTTHRRHALRSVVIHTTSGRRGKVLPGGMASNRAFAYARYQACSDRPVSWDFTVAMDGVVLQQNDPVVAFSWHAMQLNGVSTGIEMVQTDHGNLYEETLTATASLVAFLCETLGIQKQTCWETAADKPYAGHLERLDPGREGLDVVGAVGHRNLWIKIRGKLGAARGDGDPGDFIFNHLVAEHRFEKHVFHGKDPSDLRVWKGRQRLMGFEGKDVDGIPLAKTTARLKELGYRNGLWIDAMPRTG